MKVCQIKINKMGISEKSLLDKVIITGNKVSLVKKEIYVSSIESLGLGKEYMYRLRDEYKYTIQTIIV